MENAKADGPVADSDDRPMIPAMKDPALHDLLGLAKRLAVDGARFSVPHAGRAHAGPVERKPDNSVVTEVDRAIQTHIQQAVRSAYPDHALLGEETLSERLTETMPNPAKARYCWVVDPLDGTRN